MNITEDINRQLYLAIQDEIIKKLIEATPTKTGHTAGSWKLRFGSALGEFELINENGSVVMFLEEGTKAHDILPNTKNMLKFKIDQKPVFKKSRDNKLFNEKGRIFFFNKSKQAVLGYVKEGSIYYCFARKVKHPGTESRNFVKNILNNQANWDAVSNNVKQRLASKSIN